MTAVEAAAGVPKGPEQKAGMSKGKYKALMLYKGKCKSKAVVDNGKGKGTHQGDQNLPTPPACLALTIPDTPSPPKSDEPKEAAPPTGGTQTMPICDANMTPPPGTTATGEIKMTPPTTGATAPGETMMTPTPPEATSARGDANMTPPPSNTSKTGAGATTTPPPAHQRATPTSSPGDTQSPSTAPATDPNGVKGNLKGKLKAAKGKLQGGKMGGIGNGSKGKGVGNNGAAGQTSAVAEAGFVTTWHVFMLVKFGKQVFWKKQLLHCVFFFYAMTNVRAPRAKHKVFQGWLYFSACISKDRCLHACRPPQRSFTSASMLSDHTGPVAMEPLPAPGEDGKVKRVGSSKQSFCVIQRLVVFGWGQAADPGNSSTSPGYHWMLQKIFFISECWKAICGMVFFRPYQN